MESTSVNLNFEVFSNELTKDQMYNGSNSAKFCSTDFIKIVLG